MYLCSVERRRAVLHDMFPRLNGDWDKLSAILDGLDALVPERTAEIRVFRLYFGIGGRGPFMLHQIAGELGVNAAKARQLKDRAQHRLWRSSRMNPELWE